MRRGHEQSPCGITHGATTTWNSRLHPKVMNRRLAFEQLLEDCAQASGFNRVQTPIFESLNCLLLNQDKVLIATLQLRRQRRAATHSTARTNCPSNAYDC